MASEAIFLINTKKKNERNIKTSKIYRTKDKKTS